MTVTVNGERCDIATGTTVADLVRLRGARDRGTAVAVDGDVIPRGEWDQVVLADGQQVELVHAVQGG